MHDIHNNNNQNEQINNFKGDTTQNLNTITSIEKELKPKIKVIYKNKNNSVSKNSENNLKISHNSNISKEKQIEVSSPQSISARAKIDPLKFIANYYIKKDKLSNKSPPKNINPKEKGKIKHKSNSICISKNNDTIFDIINSSKNNNINYLENKLKTKKEKTPIKTINSTQGRNKKNINKINKNSNNSNKVESYNTPLACTFRPIHNKRKNKIKLYNENERYNFSKDNVFKTENYYNSNTSLTKKLYKRKILSPNINNKNKGKSQNNIFSNIKYKIYLKNKLNNKSKRNNSSINISEINNNNFGSKNNNTNYNNITTTNSNYINTNCFSDYATKKKKRIKNNVLRY